MTRRTRGAAFALGVLVILLSGRPISANSFALALFEQYLESLRQQVGIPGLSAAIVQDETIVWERGFGFQDVESSVRATPDTPYLIGGLTEALGAVVVLSYAERGRVDLNAPINEYVPSFPDSGALVADVLAHTSERSGASGFHYNPSRFAMLTGVVEGASRQQFRKTLSDIVLNRLAMRDTVPGRDVVTNSAASDLFDDATRGHYASILQRLARGYRVDRNGRATRTEVSEAGVDAADGLVSTVRDLARFDTALSQSARDDHFLLQRETTLLSWTNVASASGASAPTGLGWFVQNYNGERVVWHFGLVPNAYSAMIVKLPSRNLTLILLANSDGLAEPFDLQDGDVTASFFARLFLRIFL
jgi:CubicO group peptidase (beta-lactamase class C family)